MPAQHDESVGSTSDADRQAMLEVLAGDGPELSELLIEAGHLALRQGRSRLGMGLFDSAVFQEETRGRAHAGLAVEALRLISTTALKIGEPILAANTARKMLARAQDDKSRKQAKRLLEKAMPDSDSSGAGAPLPMIGSSPLFVPEAERPTITLADVGGLTAAKSTINRYGVLPMKDPASAEHYGVTAGGGLLLVGPPGCGKTLLAQAAAGEMGVPLYSVRGSDLLHPLYGMSERNAVSAFETARAHAPCVLFFDELDNVCPNRLSDPHAAHRSLANTMLAEMDGTKDNTGILIIGATNAPELVDDAVKRPGRFDTIVRVERPDAAARYAIWMIGLMRKHPFASDIDVELLVELSAGLTGADIAGALRDAVESVWMASFEDGVRRDVRMLDVLIALRRTCVEGRLKNRVDEEIARLWGEMLE